MKLRCVKSKFFILFLVLILMASMVYGLILKRLEKSFEVIFDSHAVLCADKAVNFAIQKYIEDNNVSYSDFVYINKNDAGEISSLSADSIKITKLKSDISVYLDSYLHNIKPEKYKINIGAVQNNMILSSMGPKITFKIRPVAFTEIKFRDDFSSCGINQVRHKIFLDIKAHVVASGFSVSKSKDVLNSVLIADTVIVGNVPMLFSGNTD